MIIGFAGRKGSGKDTAAKVLESYYGFEHLKLAGAIKVMLQSLLIYQGVDDETIHRMLEGDLKEIPSPFLGGRSPRHAMQTLGTEWGRNLMGENFWVNIFLNAAESSDEVVVCSDVRFPNEVAAIQEAGGDVFRINRGLGGNDPHPSEAFIDELEVDGEILNDAASAEEFAERVLLTLGPAANAITV